MALAAIEHQRLALDRPGLETNCFAFIEHFNPYRIAGKSRPGEPHRHRAQPLRLPGAKNFKIARQAMPIVLRPCEIARSNPASRAISGSAWIGISRG